ncbi:hypothetical protein A2422_01325 [Candidatus Woesebacteria bacterium RIFOXYC1_FULL_31_51]|nr:MAG: hypothetical protein A2185_02780 [Candidatus Woesebacteria bacterium RIFOXYA1_FULL_31_71]OGM77403.1 MAG: hypothetical protein A2375_02470 [Candidatus Woesebacteria bacterium RIFOXYB1_FULL_31_120]OGM82729.1 MAG: hypothetical protein A2422_01325 [Candidatus Woesebacteria bacterium RIFOXYC1_FULL_31_51]OGM85851.1 MAG: hypothetical protein A2595_02305 [Candidatus Woesebacteria bacterium RIFOXYD1_FULL_31_53]
MRNFNKSKPLVVHLDINSCFATIEQQANPLLRGKPIVVAAYNFPGGCILTASIEAKKLGIKTGMRVKDGKLICPKLIVLIPDPNKYRVVHKKLYNLLSKFSEKVIPKSIDEFVFKLINPNTYFFVIKEIKKRIKLEIGEWITVSVGISTNRYLAKVAASLIKPDGLVEINKDNYQLVFSKLKLTDLTGIKKRNEGRLKSVGIKTVLDFYESPIWKLKLAFGGITGLYWHTRLHGYEVDDFESKRCMFGNSYAPPFDKSNMPLEILSKLCQKTGFRLRKANLKANGIHLALEARDGNFWHMGKKISKELFESGDIYKEAVKLLILSPIKTSFKNIAVSVFDLTEKSILQLEIFDDVLRKEDLSKSLDKINEKWGNFYIHPARMIKIKESIKDRISFGSLDQIY